MKQLSEKKWQLGFATYDGELDVFIVPLFDFFAKENLTEVVPDLTQIKELLAEKKFSEVKKQFPTVIIPADVIQQYKREVQATA